MAIRVLLSARAVADLERLVEFLEPNAPEAAAELEELLLSALRVLRRHPLVGRSVSPPLRELVISYGKTGYLALYVFDARRRRVVVHAIRHQREAGYPG